MNCDALHRRLLLLERLDQAPADLRGHLAGCPACRALYRKLLQVERQAAGLPVPPPQGKQAFVQRFLADKADPPAPAPRRFGLFRPGMTRAEREKALRKVALAVAMAASLLLVVLGIWAWQRDGGPSGGRPTAAKKTPLEERLGKSDAWAKARTPLDRLRVLGDLADEAQDRVHALAQKGSLASAHEQAALYRALVERITTTEAQQVDPKERRALLQPLADHLARVESNARQLALEKPEAAEPLLELAVAAHDGDRSLRKLIASA